MVKYFLRVTESFHNFFYIEIIAIVIIIMVTKLVYYTQTVAEQQLNKYQHFSVTMRAIVFNYPSASLNQGLPQGGE